MEIIIIINHKLRKALELFVHITLLGVWLCPPLRFHHLEDLAPHLTVLGEGLAVVSGQFQSSLHAVIGHLHTFDKVSKLDVVRVGVPLGREQGQPVWRHLQDVEHLPGVGGDEVPQLGLVRQLGEGRISKLDLVWSGQGHQLGHDPGLVIILQFVTGEGEQNIVRHQVPEVAGESSRSLGSSTVL